MGKIKNFCKELVKINNRPEMKILPGNLAFYMIFAIVPIITLLLYIGSFFNVSLSGILKIFEGTVPKSILKLLEPFLHADLTLMNGISMIVGFVLLSNGAYSIIIGTNVLYKIDNKNSLTRRIKSLFLAVILIFVILFMIIIMGFGNIILKALVEIEIIKGLGLNIYNIYSLLKWPAAFLIIFTSLKTIYTIALDEKQPSKNMNKGALFASCLWLIVTWGYTYYTTNIVDYTLFYGSLASFVVLMLWIYLLSYVALLGIGINANEHFKNKKNIIEDNK